MGVNISKLKKERKFENEKIKITFSTGPVSDSFSVYIKDKNGEEHHILWEINPDRCHQNFDKTNTKIKEFIEDKIEEWVNEEQEVKRLRDEAIQKKESIEEENLKSLMDSF